MSTIAKLEQELVKCQNDLDTCDQMLEIDPSDADAIELKNFNLSQIADLKAQIAAKRSSSAAATSIPPPPPPDGSAPLPPKYDMSKHPKFRRASPETAAVPPPPADDIRVAFDTGDQVMAKYSGDKQWYQATIISKTGSSADPVYTVMFTGYGDKETKRKHEVRQTENKKRKADGPMPTAAPAAAPPSPVASPSIQNGATISAAPSVDPTLVQKREPSKVSDGPTRMAPEPKKLKGNKALDKAKSSWNDWQKHGPKKSASGGPAKKFSKDSQFRTPDLPNAKVGFTGSGKPMQKDPTRAKWNYGQSDAEGDAD